MAYAAVPTPTIEHPMSKMSATRQLRRNQRKRMSRLLSANGRPLDDSPTIARPGAIGVDITPHLTPQGVVLVITIEGQQPAGFPLSPDAAVAIGTGLIAKAGQQVLLMEQAKAVEAGRYVGEDEEEAGEIRD